MEEDEEKKDIIMNEKPMGKNESDNSKQNDTIKKPWTIAPAGGIAAKFFPSTISGKKQEDHKGNTTESSKKSPQGK